MLARRARLESHTPLRRKTKLKAGRSGTSGQFDKKARLPARRSKQRRAPPEYRDPAFIAWLETQPCRVTGRVGGNVAHHLRHTSTGAAMGGRLKDDRRAITLAPDVHIPQLHANAGFFKDWTKARLRAWEDDQLAIQRSQYLKLRAPNSVPSAQLPG